MVRSWCGHGATRPLPAPVGWLAYSAMEVTESLYVATRAALRTWLKKHHATKREIWLIYHKKGSGKPRVDYGPAVEEALCYGWIDSTVKTLDAERYAQRFTPRTKGSNWSTPNLTRVERLMTAGLMTPSGAAHLPSKKAAKAYHAKHAKRTTGTTVAPLDLSSALKKDMKASAFWKVLTPGYKRTYIRWIADAKREETRARRIAAAVDRLSRGIKPILG